MAFGSELAFGGEERENKYGVMEGNQLAPRRQAFSVLEAVTVANMNGSVKWGEKSQAESCALGFMRPPHSSRSTRGVGGSWARPGPRWPGPGA